MKIFNVKETRHLTIRELLGSDIIFKIPKFQRGFAWERRNQDQIGVFWEDLNDVVENGEEYFFGSMVFFKESKKAKKLTIVDGQQRIATIHLLFSVIRDVFNELGFINEAVSIFNEFLGKRDLLTRKVNYSYLELNKDDNEFYNKFILSEEKREEKEKKFRKEKNLLHSNRLIFNAYRYFYVEIKKKIDKMDDISNKKKFLCDLINIIGDKFVVIKNVVFDEPQAYDVFEILNAKGLPLSIMDLLKNHLFLKAQREGNLDKVEKIWNEISTKLEDDPRIINLFLRHFWMSYGELIRKKDLYRRYKREIKQKNTIEFVSKLKNEATYYAYLMSPELHWKDKKLIQFLNDLNSLNVKQCLPMLLSGAIELKEKDFKNLLELSLNFTFRYSTICNESTSVLETLYTTDIAKGIRNSPPLSIVSIKEKFKEKCPDDKTFIKNFKDFDTKNSDIARYILRELEDFDLTREKLVNKDPGELNLEHVIPKKPNEKWRNFLKSKDMDPEDWIYKIGNLTLLLKSDNTSVSNEFFDEKKKIYKKSSLSITKSIVSAEEWSSKEIDERQGNFADKAVKIWKID